MNNFTDKNFNVWSFSIENDTLTANANGMDKVEMSLDNSPAWLVLSDLKEKINNGI